MEYITGIQALNLNCSLNTCGDWHQSAISWNKLNLKNSDNSIFGIYGIEKNSHVPENKGIFYVANHIRALLDLIEEGNFAIAQGMNNDFIGTDEYNKEIFDKILLLKNHKNWDQINEFMEKEYKLQWLTFLKEIKYYE